MNHYSIERLIESGSDSDRKVIAFCGAGGKTSCIHAIRDYCLAKNKTVLVTTTTHMFLEEGCVSNVKNIIEKLDKDGYAFAGIPMSADRTGAKAASTGSARDLFIKPRRQDKISAISNDERLLAEMHADVSLIEADGARCLPFKAPKPWEPVIPEETTDIVLVMGMDAEGKRISETCYNPEGVADVLGVTTDSRLTGEMMVRAYTETYVPYIRQNFKSSRVFLYMNCKIPGETIVESGLFILKITE